ncbi:MAG: rod shape-determining protein RodA [Catenulispora sp. 13_1_20CM_3_70_7]|nr:rod shape-determining protein RodA [Catenulisporales bacterium]OLE26339.1 MAG: rod shape-determining protein RodA [Catenulispora sp. 13_1_20CM_3_70_7]
MTLNPATHPAVNKGPAPLPGAEARRRAGLLRRFDWILPGAAVALSVYGALLVWSATRGRTSLTGGDPQFFLKRHLLNLAIGLLLMAATSVLSYGWVRACAPVFYVLSLLGLLAVLTPLGTTINGAHSWIVLGGGFSIQPAEYAKFAVVLGLAVVLTLQPATAGLSDQAADAVTPRRILAAGVVAGVPIGIIVLLPDLGSAMVILAATAGLLVFAGTSVRWLVLLAAGAAGAAVAAPHLHLLAQHQVNRFAAFADPHLDPQGVGYNTAQARLAIGSGGILGKGLFNGTQTNGRYVPEQQTDFVFTVAGEELGFVGSVTLIALFAVLLLRGITIARNCDDLFGMLVCSGVVSWFAFETFENIGMTLGIMPVAGIPLPFVSYGGSSMFASFIAIGLMENVRLRSTRPAVGVG